ncbi:hypothetical protein Tco_0748794 [Tanacetum coccineum]|uniref:Uncharacterized protein n=1 Tax=Tanacetum coccineum TaxID=301880 RepID=A0ABQ4Z009_9ASTR
MQSIIQEKTKRKLHGTFSKRLLFTPSSVLLNHDIKGSRTEASGFKRAICNTYGQDLETVHGHNVPVAGSTNKSSTDKEECQEIGYPLLLLKYSDQYSALSTGTSFTSYREGLRVLVTEKTDISENRASRNFDLMIIFKRCLNTVVQALVVNVQWRLLKITLQAPFLNVQKTFDRSRSSLGLHGNDF